MTSIKLKLNRDRELASGMYPLVFQVLHRRRKKLFYTAFKLLVEEFDPVKERVVYRGNHLTHARVRYINRYIRQEIARLHTLLKELEERMPGFTLADLAERYENKMQQDKLLDFLNACIFAKKTMGAEGTATAYASTRASIADFVGDKSPRIVDVSTLFVTEYEKFLHGRGVCRNTVSFYMRNFRAMYNLAIKSGKIVCDKHPFQYVSTRPEKTVKRAISRDHTARLATVSLDVEPGLEVIRDVFMFSFYSRGMSFVDVVFLRHENIIDSFIEYERQKTHQHMRVAMTEELQALVEKYRTGSPYIFPLIDPDSPVPLYRQYRKALATFERKLKRLGKLLGIEITLTTYVARHSWATQAKQLGAPVSVISEGLGHSSEKTTSIYLKEFDQEVLDNVNLMVSRLKNG